MEAATMPDQTLHGKLRTAEREEPSSSITTSTSVVLPSASACTSSESLGLAELDEGLELATIIKAQKVVSHARSASKVMHHRNSSECSSASALPGTGRSSLRGIPPPTPPPQAALPPTPSERGFSSPESLDVSRFGSYAQVLGLGAQEVRPPSFGSPQLPPEWFRGEWSHRQRQLDSQDGLGPFEKGEKDGVKARGSSNSSNVPDSPTSSENVSEASTAPSEHWSPLHRPVSMDQINSQIALDHKVWQTDSEVRVVTLQGETPNAPMQGQGASPTNSIMSHTLVGHSGDSAGEPTKKPEDRANRSRCASCGSAMPGSPQALDASQAFETASVRFSPTSPRRQGGAPVSSKKSATKHQAIQTLLVSGTLDEASQSLYGKTRSPLKSATDLIRSDSQRLERQFSDASRASRRPSAAALAEAVRTLAYLPADENDATASLEEQQALRYAVRLTLEAADRTSRLLARTQRDKEILERQYRTTQSNLLLTEAQLSLLQEEANVRSGRPSSGANMPSSERFKLPRVPPPTVMPRTTLAPSIASPTASSARHFQATSVTADARAKDAADDRLRGGVSIASLRKTRAAAGQTQVPAKQRYVPKGMMEADKNGGEEEDAEVDSDDERLGIVKRAPPKEISLSDFLDASRMSLAEISQMSPQQPSVSMLMPPPPSMMEKAMANGPRKSTNFLRTLADRGRKAGIPSLKKSKLVAENPGTMSPSELDLTSDMISRTSPADIAGRGRDDYLGSRIAGRTKANLGDSASVSSRGRRASLPDSVAEQELDEIDEETAPSDAVSNREQPGQPLVSQAGVPLNMSNGMRVSLISFLEETHDADTVRGASSDSWADSPRGSVLARRQMNLNGIRLSSIRDEQTWIETLST